MDGAKSLTEPNPRMLLIWPFWTNFSEILIGIQKFSFDKMHLKISSEKCRPFCLGLNVLTDPLLLCIYTNCMRHRWGVTSQWPNHLKHTKRPCYIPEIRVEFYLLLQGAVQLRIIDLIHKSHNAPVPYPTMLHSFLVWMEHCGIWNRCIPGYLKLVYWQHIIYCFSIIHESRIEYGTHVFENMSFKHEGFSEFSDLNTIKAIQHSRFKVA